MRRLINTVQLKFFQDDASGEYGLAHKDTVDSWDDVNFNAFWGGIGIFHDVFEHWFERKHKYFQGDYAMNVAGEMVAMGAMWYYVSELDLRSERDLNPNSWTSMEDNLRLTTQDEVQEAIQEGYCNYGYELVCNVPYQRPTENCELEYQIDEYWENVKDFHTSTEYEQERQDGLNYKKSVTKSKIARLHRYGYRMAERLVPCTPENTDTLRNFILFWNKFCKDHRAEDYQNSIRGITFSIYREGETITWGAVIETGLYLNDVEIDSENLLPISMEDEMYQFEEEFD